MLVIHKKIFSEICNNNIILYEDYITTIKKEYSLVIKDILESSVCETLRYNTHKLMSVISILHLFSFNTPILGVKLSEKSSHISASLMRKCVDCINNEIIYICSLILYVDKKETDIAKYTYYIEMLRNANTLQII